LAPYSSFGGKNEMVRNMSETRRSCGRYQ